MTARSDEMQVRSHGLRGSGASLKWIAVVGVAVLPVVRCLVVFTSDVPWDLQEVLTPDKTGALGPGATALFDWLGMLTLFLAVVASILLGSWVHTGALALWALGVAVSFYHGLINADALRFGGNWVGGTALGLAALHVADTRKTRNLLISILVALLFALGVKALFQVTIEHERDVAFYEQNKESIIARYGWKPGEVEQLRFENRLLRNEAKGVFGLTNVFASVVMGLTAVSMGVLWSAFRPARRKTGLPAICGGLTALGLTTLVLTRSRGGLAALGIALAVAFFAWLVSRYRPQRAIWAVAGFFPPAAVMGVLIVSGAIGTPQKSGRDLALLLRAWHLSTASTIWYDHPIVGIGPGGFQEAFMVFKNPLSPENVKDPHNVLAAWVSMLGLGGIAWSVLLGWLLWRISLETSDAIRGSHSGGRGDLKEGDPPIDPPSATPFLAVSLIIFLVQYWAQSSLMTGWNTLLWFASAIGFLLVGLILTRSGFTAAWPVQLGLFAGALGLFVHNQVEMAITNTMAGPVLMVIVGLAASGVGFRVSEIGNDHVPRCAMSRTLPRTECDCLGGLIAGTVAFIFLLIGVIPVSRAEEGLKLAATSQRLDRPKDVIQDLRVAKSALPSDARPDYFRALVFVKVGMERERDHQELEAIQSYTNAFAAMEEALERRGNVALVYKRRAHVAAQLARLTGEQAWKDRVISDAENAVVSDPNNRFTAKAMASLVLSMGRCDLAMGWYRRALEIDDQLFLMPAYRFQTEERLILTKAMEGLPCFKRESGPNPR